MITGKGKFNFIDKRLGVTKEGEQYLVFNVLSEDNAKYNFITKDPKVIDKLSPLNIQKFALVNLIFSVDRVYNQETRFLNWHISLIGVE